MKALGQNKITKAGLTLIELLVALAIFSAFIVAIMQVTVSSLSAQRKAFSTQSVQEAGRFALELMTREIRIAKFNSIANGGSQLNITFLGTPVTYAFDNTNHQLSRNGVPITPDNLDVDGFFVNATGSTDHPVITIVMQLVSKEAKSIEKNKIYVQSTITPRI